MFLRKEHFERYKYLNQTFIFYAFIVLLFFPISNTTTLLLWYVCATPFTVISAGKHKKVFNQEHMLDPYCFSQFFFFLGKIFAKTNILLHLLKLT